MKLGIVTALHGRRRLTRIMGQYYDSLNIPGVEILCAASYTEKEDCSPLSDRWETVQAPNAPRSDKWIAAGLLLAPHKPDVVMVVGSDDFVHPDHITRGIELIEGGADVIHPQTCYFFDTPTRRLALGTFHRIGAGRMISRRVAESLDWQLWESGLNRNIDRSMGLRMRDYPVTWHPSPCVLDVKVDEEPGRNIWGFDYLSRCAMNTDGQDWKPLPMQELYVLFPTVANALIYYETDC